MGGRLCFIVAKFILNGNKVVVVQCEAAQGSLSFPCAFQDLLADGEGNDSAQIRARKGGPQEASDVRGHPASLRQEEEDGHPLCPPGAQAQAWQEVLLAWTSVARRRMGVPRRRGDVGGEAPRQGRGVLQEGSAVAKIRQQVRKDAKVVKRIAPYQK